jgi:hypothetical protein
MTLNQRKAAALRAGNILVGLVAADPVKYPVGSLVNECAEMVLRGGTNIRAELERRAGLSVIRETMNQANKDLTSRDLTFLRQIAANACNSDLVEMTNLALSTGDEEEVEAILRLFHQEFPVSGILVQHPS